MDPRLPNFGAQLDGTPSLLAQLARSLEELGCIEPSGDTLARIALSQLDRPGDPVIGQITRREGAETAFCQLSETHTAQEASGGLLRGGGLGRPQVLAEAVKIALRASQSLKFGISTPFSAAWPHELADLGDAAPLVLWTAGDAGLLNARRKVTIVSGLAGSLTARARAVSLSAELALRGHIIVTPASTGTDLEVISSALDAGGRVVVVTAGGLDRPTPAAGEALREVVQRGGAIVSETPPGARATQMHRIARTRLLAALSPRLIVLEAGTHSPAVTAARLADDLIRDVAALDFEPGPWSAGSQLLVDELTARPVGDVRDLLRESPRGAASE